MKSEWQSICLLLLLLMDSGNVSENGKGRKSLLRSSSYVRAERGCLG